MESKDIKVVGIDFTDFWVRTKSTTDKHIAEEWKNEILQGLKILDIIKKEFGNGIEEESLIYLLNESKK